MVENEAKPVRKDERGALYVPPMSANHTNLSFAQLRAANATRVKHWHGEKGVAAWSNSDWAVATAGEIGEACNIVKKLNRVRDGITGNTIEREELQIMLAMEMADVAIYLDLWAQHNLIDLASAIRDKFNLVSIREKFPERL